MKAPFLNTRGHLVLFFIDLEPMEASVILLSVRAVKLRTSSIITHELKMHARGERLAHKPTELDRQTSLWVNIIMSSYNIVSG